MPGLALLLGSQAAAHAQSSVMLLWTPSSSSNVVSYNLYVGPASATYTNESSAGNSTNGTVSGLQQGDTYFFAVTAVDSFGLESLPSAEVSYTVPMTNQGSMPVVVLTSPTNGSSYSAPVDIQLAADVTTNGHSIGKVQFLNGSSLVGESLSPPYTFLWTNVPYGDYLLAALAVYDSGAGVTSAPVSISVSGLSPPWQTMDIGTPPVTGGASISNDLFTVAGSGNINSYADNFRFLYQPLTGDGQINGEIRSMQNTTGGRAGVMVRENLTSGSRYALMGISPNGRFRWQRRSTTGGSTSAIRGTSSPPPAAWVKVIRTGATFLGYDSVDGTNWTLLGSNDISMAANIYVGLAVASGTTNLTTATLTNVLVVP